MNNKIECFSCGTKLDYKLSSNHINPQCKICITDFYEYMENNKTYR